MIVRCFFLLGLLISCRVGKDTIVATTSLEDDSRIIMDSMLIEAKMDVNDTLDAYRFNYRGFTLFLLPEYCDSIELDFGTSDRLWNNMPSTYNSNRLYELFMEELLRGNVLVLNRLNDQREATYWAFHFDYPGIGIGYSFETIDGIEFYLNMYIVE